MSTITKSEQNWQLRTAADPSRNDWVVHSPYADKLVERGDPPYRLCPRCQTGILKPYKGEIGGLQDARNMNFHCDNCDYTVPKDEPIQTDPRQWNFEGLPIGMDVPVIRKRPGQTDFNREPHWQLPPNYTPHQGSLMPVIYHGEIDPESDIGGLRGYEGRWPIMYDYPEGKIHIGPEGATHEQVGEILEGRGAWAPGHFVEGWIGHNPESEKDDPRSEYYGVPVGWYGGGPFNDDVDENVARYYNNFLKDAPKVEGEGGYGHAYRMSMEKTADKLHDFLMNPQSRPDLQTPEGKEWLEHLTTLHNDKTDQLMPWLTREWKKGRVLPAGRGAITHYYIPTPEEVADGRAALLDGENPATLTNRTNLSHWGDFLNSNHPLRREMGDIMQHKVPEFHDRVRAWDQAMENERAQQAARGGTVVHQWPDNWTVRRLDTPDELEGEGDAMGHCVGSYAHEVANGNTSIYSLRDPQGQPHVTTEIIPQSIEPGFKSEEEERVRRGEPSTTPEGGEVIQIQGASNQEPKEEYKRRMKEWFQTMHKRPEWSADHDDYPLEDMSEVEPHHWTPNGGEDEYGLPNESRVDWDTVLKPSEQYRSAREYGDPEDIYRLALAREEIPELAQATEKAVERESENLIACGFNEMRDMNYDYISDHAGEWPEGREDEEWKAMSKEEKDKEQEEYEVREREAEDDIAREHGGMRMVNGLYHWINKHWNKQTQQYENELQR